MRLTKILASISLSTILALASQPIALSQGIEALFDKPAAKAASTQATSKTSADYAEIDRLNKAIAQDPKNSDLYADRAQVYKKSGDLGKAQSDINTAFLLQKGDHQRFYVIRGGIETEQKNYLQALNDLSKALTMGPKTSALFANRACVYQLSGRKDEALEDFNSAIKLNPVDHDVLMFRSNLLYMKGKFQEALADCDAAIKLEHSPNPETKMVRAAIVKKLDKSPN